MSVVKISLVSDIYPIRPLSEVPKTALRAFDELRSSDLSIGNFEIPLSNRGVPIEKLLNIRADPVIAESLHITGLDAVTVANNHSVDYGWEGLEQTIDVLRRNGLRVVGAGANIHEAMRPAYFNLNGFTVGLIGFSCLLPCGMAANEQRPGISSVQVKSSYEIDPIYQLEEPGDISAVTVRTSVTERDKNRATKAVGELRSNCDFVIASIHWGYGSGDTQAEYQKPFAKALIESGADVVHGHHPHAVQEIAFHQGKPILFSGNVFIGQQIFLEASAQIKSMWADMSSDGYIAQLLVGQSGGVQLEIVPITLDAERLPKLARGTEFERSRERLARLSSANGIKIEVSTNRLIVKSERSGA